MRWGWCAAGVAVLFAIAPAAYGQSTDEVIDDPMLRAKTPASSPTPRGATSAPAPVPDKPTPPRIWRAVVTLRGTTQTLWDDLPGGPKDVLEFRARAVLSAGQT